MTDAGNVPYGDSLAAVRSLLDRTLHQSDAVLSEIMAHLSLTTGKNVRAALLLAAAADEQGQVPASAIRLAASLEIMHLATLVHDDVIDEAPTRRGLPSIQSKFGKKIAVISGDYLFCLTFSLIADLSQDYASCLTDFSRAITRICLGEMGQLKHQGDPDLSVYGHLRIIAGKTAALFALALYVGSIARGDAEREARQLARFGYQVGMLFQVADDCLDYESTTATLRKQVHHDLADGVITLPLILHLVRHPELKPLIKPVGMSAADVETIVADVVAAGSVRQARQVADRYSRKALQLLPRIAGPERRQRLQDLLEAIQTRTY